ncbi:hypothetical protein A2368_00740 [Candidatus Collierbacteria bacterium RIFOXYB1_FULL_49_13]|uniref:Uncharacterized protein n=1 Tax=Candidatus Collierbacteria bacterium RIFOXYB1_FULL_49_13 TaxID=1817728 RepID=A0A1F5FF43_9BACT|nr:MAG: hypothetical protein A2368_00740 [Candidatus Collierbacteria bacterium RIFOXYB1_FULL_49_13]
MNPAEIGYSPQAIIVSGGHLKEIASLNSWDKTQVEFFVTPGSLKNVNAIIPIDLLITLDSDPSNRKVLRHNLRMQVGNTLTSLAVGVPPKKVDYFRGLAEAATQFIDQAQSHELTDDLVQMRQFVTDIQNKLSQQP